MSKNMYKLQTDCVKTVTVTAREPDVVPVLMSLDKIEGSAPLAVTVTVKFLNNTDSDISNFISVLWVNDLSIALPSTFIAANSTVDIVKVITISTAGTYYIRPEMPDDSLLVCDNKIVSELVYGDVNFDGKVTQEDADSVVFEVESFSLCQKALGDVVRNGIVNIGDYTLIISYIKNYAILIYTPVGRKVVTIQSQIVTVTSEPVHVSCLIPSSFTEYEDGILSTTVLAGNIDRNILFNIFKDSVLWFSTLPVVISGDLQQHTYDIVVSKDLTRNLAGYTINLSVNMVVS